MKTLPQVNGLVQGDGVKRNCYLSISANSQICLPFQLLDHVPSSRSFRLSITCAVCPFRVVIFHHCPCLLFYFFNFPSKHMASAASLSAVRVAPFSSKTIVGILFCIASCCPCQQELTKNLHHSLIVGESCLHLQLNEGSRWSWMHWCWYLDQVPVKSK